MRLFLLGIISLIVSTAAQAKSSSDLTVSVQELKHGKAIAEKWAVCLPTPDGKSNAKGQNWRPTISWSTVPKATASIAVFVMDPDVPADFSDAGKEGKIIAAKAKRQDFYHYGIVGIPAQATMLIGAHDLFEKNPGYPYFVNPTDRGITELVNDMGLNNYVPTPTAYGGPCPPWNDARVHHYHFIVLALDKDAPVEVEAEMKPGTQPDDGPMTARHTFARLMESKHVLAKGVLVGTYTLNPSLRMPTTTEAK